MWDWGGENKKNYRKRSKTSPRSQSRGGQLGWFRVAAREVKGDRASLGKKAENENGLSFRRGNPHPRPWGILTEEKQLAEKGDQPINPQSE